jgi:hypothetical protein
MNNLSLIGFIKKYLPALLFFCLAPASGSQTLSYYSANFSTGTFSNLHVEQNELRFLGKWDFFDTTFAPRNEFGLGYDETKKSLVMFGGRDQNNSVFGDTWEWDASSGWTQITPSTAPSARYGHKIVWIGDNYLLFGGRDAADNVLDDTWLYDGTTHDWSQVVVVSSPEARAFFCMGYDPNQRKVILISGEEQQFQPVASTTWEFDIDASSWSPRNVAPAPSPRIGASIAYDSDQHVFVLFGGRDTTWNDEDLFSDTWVYDAATRVWTDKNPASPPPALVQAGMLYDPLNKQIVLTGGLRSATLQWGPSYFFDVQKNRWAVFNVLTTPLGRYGHEMFYDRQLNRGAVVGGRRTTSTRSTWFYTLRATGTWTSGVEMAPSNMNIGWEKINVTFSSAPLLSGTSLYLQVAYSTDGVQFDEFRGPGGSTSAFYLVRDGSDVSLWSDSINYHAVKVKALFSSDDIPNTFNVDQINLTYNRSPAAPAMLVPIDGARTNDPQQSFTWYQSSDPDGVGDEPFLFQLMVATSTDFFVPVINTSALSSTSPTITHISTSVLSQTTWYWRVRAQDVKGLDGVWSTPFSLYLDTSTPASAVQTMSAAAGPGHGQATLTWTFPGDDDGPITGGQILVRYSSSGPILTEQAWIDAGAGQSGVFSSSANAVISTAVSALTEATTYYFSIKTVDENGNESPVSLVSPSAKTNNTPNAVSTMTLSRGPVNSEITISWTYPGDEPVGPDDGLAVVRYSKTRLMADETDWGLADGERTFSYHASSGEAQVSIVTGLETETTYYIAMKLVDAFGRSSALSTVHPSIVSNRPPVAISQFSVSRTTANGTVNVSWTYAGDDDLPTTNGLYIIRYATSAISSEGAWSAAPFQSTGLFTGTTGSVFQKEIAGLANGTTYFFSIRTQDPLGSLSLLSTVSPSTCTNGAPVISLISPSSGTLSNPTVITWNASDPDGDALVYVISLSLDGGVTYPVTLSTETSPVSQYTWSISNLPNGASYRIRITATDPMGLVGVSSSTSNLTRSGYSTPPSVVFVSQPATGQEVGGAFIFRWSLVAPSTFSTYSFDLYLSTNGGTTYQYLVATTTDNYTFDSTLWINASGYRVRLRSRDSSVPPLEALVDSNIFDIHNNIRPGDITLLKPLEDDFPSIFHMTFSWQPVVDDDGDVLTYRLNYWTAATVTSPVVVSNLHQTSYTPDITTLVRDVVYFWNVTVSDGQTDVLSETEQFTISSTKAKSPDRMITVEVLSSFPSLFMPQRARQ